MLWCEHAHVYVYLSVHMCGAYAYMSCSVCVYVCGHVWLCLWCVARSSICFFFRCYHGVISEVWVQGFLLSFGSVQGGLKLSYVAKGDHELFDPPVFLSRVLG